MTQASWRWCFAINLPVALVALIMVTLFLRKDLVGPQPLPQAEGRDMSTRSKRFTIRLLTIDYGGQLLFLWGLGLLILAFTWAGGSYSWDSAHVIPPLVIGAVLTIAWVFYEYSMSPHHLMSRVFPLQRAMIPWELITQRDIILLFIVNFASGMAMYAIMYFLDLYFTLVKGQSASQGGINLLYFLPGLGGRFSERSLWNSTNRSLHSWCILCNVRNECLATPNTASAFVWQSNFSCWHHGAYMGSQCRADTCHLRHDGSHWLRCWYAHDSGISARHRFLP